MARRRQHAPLRAYLNNRLVGHYLKETSGATSFQYDETWLDWDHAIPVSLSLPLREDAYRGAAVAAVFENLLPDSDALRKRVAEKVGAEGTDAYSLLAAIGRDCVGLEPRCFRLSPIGIQRLNVRIAAYTSPLLEPSLLNVEWRHEV